MKMKQNFPGKVCLLALIVILTGAQLFAQKVTGVVVDESNTQIPGNSKYQGFPLFTSYSTSTN